MAKLPPTSTGATAPVVTTDANADRWQAATAELTTARARIAELEALLGTARAQIAAKAGPALAFAFPLLDANAAARTLGQRVTFAFWEGTLGLKRQQHFWSLFQGLYQSNAKMGDGTPVHLPGHAVLWMLDTMRFGGES